MPWERTRSIRDPAFWVPLALIAPITLGFGGLALHGVRAFEAYTASDPQGAALAAPRLLRTFAWMHCVGLLAVSALLGRYYQLGLRQGRVPPAGWWSLGTRRAATGSTAVRISRAGIALALLLGLLGLASPLVVERFLQALRAATPG